MTNGPALSTAKGGEIYVGSEIQASLSHLNVLYANHFEGVSIDPNVAKETEVNFYKGAPPEWDNFYLSDQAESTGTGTPFIKRDGYKQLMQQIHERKKSPGTSTIKLFHQLGCGGTTLAMKVLWDLRKTFRCAILTSPISDTRLTAKEVIHLFTAGHLGHQNTVLLLVNDEHVLNKIPHEIMEELRQQQITTYSHVAILLHCDRNVAISNSDDIVVKDELSQKEKTEFNKKKEELRKNCSKKCQQFHGFNIMQTGFDREYIQRTCTILKNVKRTNRPRSAQLVAILSLLNAYVPGSYLLQSQCLDFLKHSSTDVELSLEDKMQPFSHLIITFQKDKKNHHGTPCHSTVLHQTVSRGGVSRSDTARNLLTNFFCKTAIPQSLPSFIKDMLTNREIQKEENQTNGGMPGMKEKKKMFSQLILDIQGLEDKEQAASVLKVASRVFYESPVFPQALARFHYIVRKDYNAAQMWAETAKQRSPTSSFIADTMGQVHKHHLNSRMSHHKPGDSTSKDPANPRDILQIAKKAIEAFKHEEQLAENELCSTKVSFFNIRGQFGYLQICKLIYDFLVPQSETWKRILTRNVTLNSVPGLLKIHKCYRFNDLLYSLKDEVEKKCHFFNAYLSYSKPDKETADPSYIWPDVLSCYNKYVEHPPLVLGHEISLKGDALRQDDTPESYMHTIIKERPKDDEKTSPAFKDLIEEMGRSYDCTYAKYLQSRYLLPIFYLCKDKDNKIVLSEKNPLLIGKEKPTEGILSDKHSKEEIRHLKGKENLFKLHGVVRNHHIFAKVAGTEIQVDANSQQSLWKPCEVSFFLGFTVKGLIADDIHEMQAIQERPTEKLKYACRSTEWDSSDWTNVKPKVTETEEGQTYSLQSEAGHFTCSVSSLRWVSQGKVNFTYQFISWEDYKERPSCMDYIPAGPLLNITVTAGSTEEIHLPHWICIDDSSVTSDMFAVLHVKDCGDFMDRVSEVTPSHVKLLEPHLSPLGTMIRRKLGIPIKIYCDVLIYKTSKTYLTLHVYLVPPDPAVKQMTIKTQEVVMNKSRILWIITVQI
ncbi:LOW QUALITY PROTEIN: sterile alpha motif domain-containing protein 9 [Thalassophryne amazonica]|uniref:LOW QUALITY PROTEIN: sterile alpha motif domain-containing protein 9 n=1 Tax=Thalassophryne amazonica TaxID=390379 RepID=UPI001471AFFD|nr:LOW QUALITY PROTEIN: sterile alpha motif domain-containing protein 9 [Thalassophryne amazonica]